MIAIVGDHAKPRHSGEVFGSRAGDAKQWQHSGGVAGVAAHCGGDVVVAVLAQDADGEVAQAGLVWPRFDGVVLLDSVPLN
jgi:hypothetical protein